MYELMEIRKRVPLPQRVHTDCVAERSENMKRMYLCLSAYIQIASLRNNHIIPLMQLCLSAYIQIASEKMHNITQRFTIETT